MPPENRDINRAILNISRRAESVNRETLVKTFVDVGPLFSVLSSHDHQIVYGRRGTGKTHALINLAEQGTRKGRTSIYVDLRNIGSSGGLYGDTSIPLPQRATRLALDVLGAIHDELLNAAITLNANLSALGPALDELASAATEVEIKGEVKSEESSKANSANDMSSHIQADLQKSLGVSASRDSKQKSEHSQEVTLSRTGEARYRLHFGRVTSALSDVVAALTPNFLLIVLDEWSTVPLDLQPYLADLLRRALFPVKGITVKIAAIEQRTNFKIEGASEYTGIEVGADASADVDLDDYMVFDNNKERSVAFFQRLLFSYYNSVDLTEDAAPPIFTSPEKLIQAAFTQQNAFDDFVKAAEGVPRDAFNVLFIAAQRSMDEKISIPTIRVAARTWYQRDKEAAIRGNSDAQDLLNWIIDAVIAHRKARAFLLRTNTKNAIVDALFDARLLHVVKRSISGQEEAGLRYDAYKLDYGCYVDLLATKAAPTGFFAEQDVDQEDSSAAQVLVPENDYRAIRRAVLDIALFEQRHSPDVETPDLVS